MKFEDVFPYNKTEYSFIVDFFNRYVDSKLFASAFSYWTQGVSSCIHEFAGINFPSLYDEKMQPGPVIWEGNPYSLNECELDFHQFVIIMLIASKVFLHNMREKEVSEYERWFNYCTQSENVYNEERFLKDVALFQKNFSDVIWIMEHCYTEEHRRKEWYEKYGRYLNFSDVDDIVEMQFK